MILRPLVAGSEKSADKTAYNSSAESYPTIVFTAMMVVLVVGMVFWFRSWTVVSVFLVSRGLGRERALRGLMLGRVLMCTSVAATRSSEGCAAECKAGKSENRKLFESLVHITPSLSLFGFMRTILAAYNMIGHFSIVF